MRNPRIIALLAAIIAAGIAITVGIDNTDDGHGHKTHPVTIHIDGIDADHQADDTVTAPPDAVKRAAAVTEHDLRDETPPAAEHSAPGQLERQQRLEQRIRRTLDPLPVAGATQGFPGCRTEFVRNQSSRNGIRPIWIVDHYTVSGNRPGWGDVNAVVGLFNTASAQVSAHFVIDGEGNCAYIVPLESKSWANAAGNSLSVNIEVINSGRESVYIAPAGQARLTQVEQEIGRRTGIPVRRGNVPAGRPGIVQHKDGGLAWGGHVDITPYSIDDEVQAVVAASSRVAIAKRDRAACRRVKAYRDRRRHHLKPTRRGTARFDHRRARVHKHGLRCVGGKAKRRAAQ